IPRLCKLSELWNDFTTLWKTNYRCGPLPLLKREHFVGLDRDWLPGGRLQLVGEFSCSRVYFNKDMIDHVYKYFLEHIERVRKARYELDLGRKRQNELEIPKISCIPVGKVRIVPLKRAQFYQTLDSKNVAGPVKCAVESCWDAEPYEVTLDDLEHW